jgi:hypothetical protein
VCVRDGAVQAHRPDYVVCASDQGHRDGRRHHDLPWHRQRPGQDVQADGNDLQQRLDLAAPTGGDDALPDNPEPQPGDGQLAQQDHHRDPPAELTERRQRDQGRADQGLVGDRVGDLAEVGDQAAAAGDLAVQQVGNRGDAEGHARRDPVAGAARQQEQHERRHHDEPQHGQRVGDVDQARLGDSGDIRCGHGACGGVRTGQHGPAELRCPARPRRRWRCSAPSGRRLATRSR